MAISAATKPVSQLRLLAVLLLILAILLTALLCRQRIFDWWRLRNYAPPSSISMLADQDTMTAYTRHVFFVNHPQLLTSLGNFRQQCPEDTQDIVLGCYHPGQNGIFIYDVTDSELQGVQQVTAAHEVLHGIYARLSSDARAQLDKELDDYYADGLTDQRVKAEVKIYQRTEPGDVDDEMSCTFGTELPNLPPALEAYYRQFFTNRQVIVNYEQQYVSAFTSRQAQIAADDQTLKSMQADIAAKENAVATLGAQINADRTNLQTLRATDPQSYNAAIPTFNANVDRYNSQLSVLQAEISRYNQLVASRNGLAGALASLDRAIDTRLPAQNTAQ